MLEKTGTVELKPQPMNIARGKRLPEAASGFGTSRVELAVHKADKVFRAGYAAIGDSGNMVSAAGLPPGASLRPNKIEPVFARY